jgi:hypothetical protein
MNRNASPTTPSPESSLESAGTHPSTSPLAAPAPPPRRWTAVLKRWPTALAVGLAALGGGGGESGSTVEAYGEVLPLLPLLYLAVATLQRLRASWPGLIVGIMTVVVLRLFDVVAPSTVFVAIALGALVWNAASGHLHRSGMLRLEALGMIGFGALALLGLAVDPDLGRYLVAAGWFFHGVWDFVHLRLDKVVARSYAEWCGVFDVLVAVQLVFLG